MIGGNEEWIDESLARQTPNVDKIYNTGRGHRSLAMMIRGRKQRKTIVLDVEPDLPDGTEVEVIIPATWQAEHEALLRIGCHPEFGTDTEKAREEWTPPRF